MAEITIRPRFYETDAMGHINNINIAAWFETGRLAFLESLQGDFSISSPPWVLATVTMDYLAEIHYGQDVTVQVQPKKLGTSSLSLESLIRRGDEILVRGSAVVVHVGEDNKKRPIPDDIRRSIECKLSAQP